MQAMNDHTNKQLKEQLQGAKDHLNKGIEILNEPNQTETLDMKE